MEWLKRVEKALKDSVLVDVTVITLNATQIQLSFNLEDGTHIITPIITLPKGDKGDTGAQGIQGEQGVSVVDVSINASNHLIVTLSNGTEIDAGVIQGGGTITVDDAISSTSENPVQNKVIYNALQSKQNALTTTSVVDGVIDKVIGFDSLGEIVKQSPTNEIFFAAYGSTTYSEIFNAIKNGKLCICIDVDMIYIASGISGTTQIRFFRIYDFTTDLHISEIVCETPNRWYRKTAVTLQPQLVSGQNIKTINGNSLLGSGNLKAGMQLYWHTITITNPSNYKTYPSVTIKVLAIESTPIDSLIVLQNIEILSFSVVESAGELYPLQYDFSTRGYVWLYDDNTTSIVKYNIDGDTYTDVVTTL